ncbi:uncharacterized protein LOC133856850 [Alnus glutinosa]|uniref:uncharacterized protein LOC133856850 n=1 Tax=Alnus glutinosa TaxID=3517 RepID=UPI002D79294C|nr:uncharacterized protein LOC133856850 [Alnus glutinosa]
MIILVPDNCRMKDGKIGYRTVDIQDGTVHGIGEHNFPWLEVDVNEFDISSLEFDPGLRSQIWDYNVNQQDEIRKAYIKADAAFCLPCFLFNKPSGHPAQRVFTIDGFKSLKKVREGKNCAFLNHIGKYPNSFHRIAERSYEDLKNQSQHIQNVFENFTSEQIANNRLQLKASIDVVRVLAFQGVAFRGRDESVDSTNRGNFLEILNLMVSYNEQIAEVIAKAPKNAFYTSPMIQKEILHIFSTKVKEAIRKEIGNAKFCIMVDEARDESMKEQMAIVLRFVDKDGFVRELAASKEVIPVHQFFTNLSSIVNIVCASCNRFEELRISQTAEIAYLIEINEIESGMRLNQIIILKIINVGTTSSQRAEADSVYQLVNKFYPQDFTDLEKEQLEIELNHYKHNVVQHSSFQALSNISKFCQWLVSTGKSAIYELVFRVIVLVLTLSVSTPTTEQAFSAMNIVKTRLRNKIEDEFLMDSLMVYIEREVATTISIDSIIDDFRDSKKRQVPF